MTENYHFDIQNTRAKQIRLLANLILFLNAFVFIYFGIHTGNRNTIIIGALSAIITLINFRLNPSWKIHLLALTLIVICWISIGYWWIGIPIPVLSIFAQITSSNKNIVFTYKHIELSAPFGKTFKWFELQNIVLKDGLLTLDFKNNKLLQTPILDELNEAETKQFNDFCNKQLAANN